MFKLPYSILPTRALKRGAHVFGGVAEKVQNNFPGLKLSLKQAQIDISAKEYLGMCFLSTSVFFVFFSIFLMVILTVAGVEKFLLFGLVTGFIVTFFVFAQQLYYPKLLVGKRIKNIERNLLGALQNIYIQLNSGIPLFTIFVNISNGDYGEISSEFSRAVREINAGRSEEEALEDLVAINPSLFFRRAIWQLVNGLKSGADMSSVINETINLLSQEQVLQIQRYGSQLNPVAMFYMLVAVIAPSLGMTFLIMLSSFIALTPEYTKIVFYGLFCAVVFFQIMFMGMIKSRRPNLLGD
jgi:pilus assembly protein TadC